MKKPFTSILAFQPRLRVGALLILVFQHFSISAFSQDVLEYQLPYATSLTGSDGLRIICQPNTAPGNSSQIITVRNFGNTVAPWLSGTALSLICGSASQTGLAYGGTGGSFGSAAFQPASAFDPAGAASTITTGSNFFSGYYAFSGTLTGTAVLAGTNATLTFQPVVKVTSLSSTSQAVIQHGRGLLQSQLTVSTSNFNSSVTFPSEPVSGELDVYTVNDTDNTQNWLNCFEADLFSYGTCALHGAYPTGYMSVVTERTAQIDPNSMVVGYMTHLGNQSTQISGTTVLNSAVAYWAGPVFCSGSQQLLSAVGLQIDPQCIPGCTTYGIGIRQSGTADVNHFFGQIFAWNTINEYGALAIQPGGKLSLSGTLLDVRGVSGSNGQVLVSTGSSVQWMTPAVTGTIPASAIATGTLGPGVSSSFLAAASPRFYYQFPLFYSATGWTATSGSGGNAGLFGFEGALASGTLGGGATSAIVAVAPQQFALLSGTAAQTMTIDWSRHVAAHFAWSPNNIGTSATSSSVYRFILGSDYLSYLGSQYGKFIGIELRFAGNGSLGVYAIAQNGSALTSASLSAGASFLCAIDGSANYYNCYSFDLVSDGSGNLTLTINNLNSYTAAGIAPTSWSLGGYHPEFQVIAVSNDSVSAGTILVFPVSISSW